MDADVNHIEYQDINPPVVVVSKVNHVSRTTKFIKGKAVTFDMSSLDDVLNKTLEQQEKAVKNQAYDVSENVQRGFSVLYSMSGEDSPEEMGKKFGSALKEIYSSSGTVDYFRMLRQQQEEINSVLITPLQAFNNYNGDISNVSFKNKSEVVSVLNSLGLKSSKGDRLSRDTTDSSGDDLNVKNGRFSAVLNSGSAGVAAFKANGNSLRNGDYSDAVVSMLPVMLKLSRYSDEIESSMVKELNSDKNAMRNFKLAQSEMKKIAESSEKLFSEGYHAMSRLEGSAASMYIREAQRLKKDIDEFESDYRKACKAKGVEVDLCNYDKVADKRLDDELIRISKSCLSLSSSMVHHEATLDDYVKFAGQSLNMKNSSVRHAVNENKKILKQMSSLQKEITSGSITSPIMEDHFNNAYNGTPVSPDDIVSLRDTGVLNLVSENAALNDKADHLKFLQSVGVDCMRKGMSEHDAGMLQLGRFIQSFEKKLSAECYSKDDVERTTRQIFSREENRLGSYEEAKASYLGKINAKQDIPEVVLNYARSERRQMER